MPRVILSPPALTDLERLRDFLKPKNAELAKRAAKTIVKAIQVLGLQPSIGRPIDGMDADFREWVIDFGSSGYVALYRYSGGDVTILAIRHQLENDYQ